MFTPSFLQRPKARPQTFTKCTTCASTPLHRITLSQDFSIHWGIPFFDFPKRKNDKILQFFSSKLLIRLFKKEPGLLPTLKPLTQKPSSLRTYQGLLNRYIGNLPTLSSRAMGPFLPSQKRAKSLLKSPSRSSIYWIKTPDASKRIVK